MGTKFQHRAVALYIQARVYRSLAWPGEQQPMVKGDQPTHERHLGTAQNSQGQTLTNTSFPKYI